MEVLLQKTSKETNNVFTPQKFNLTTIDDKSITFTSTEKGLILMSLKVKAVFN